MKTEPFNTGQRQRRQQPWQATIVTAIVLSLAAYSAWQRGQARRDAPPAADSPAAASSTDEHPSSTVIANQSIRDMDGRVAFHGDVDVGPTLQRIKAGRLLDYPNDGSTFQNRERRLPRMSAGYYKEYVHPTPGLRGPGPQRVVAGDAGEIYYTPDHYQTFRRLDK